MLLASGVLTVMEAHSGTASSMAEASEPKGSLPQSSGLALVLIRKAPDVFINSSSVAETNTRETKHRTRRAGELRFITPVGPEELTLQALSPEQRDYRVFTDRL